LRDRDQGRANQVRKYVSWAGISEPRPGGDRTLLGERVLVFRGGDSFEIFDQDGKTLGEAANVRGYRKGVGYQVELLDTEVRAVVGLATRGWSRRGLAWKYVVCTPDDQEFAALTRPRGWRFPKQCTVTRGTERIATLEKDRQRSKAWTDRLLGSRQRWRLTDELGRHAARITLARETEDDAAYVLEVEAWVTGPLRVIALAACVVVDQGMASLSGVTAGGPGNGWMFQGV
jgi:hypothetical protein